MTKLSRAGTEMTHRRRRGAFRRRLQCRVSRPQHVEWNKPPTASPPETKPL